MLDEQVEQPSRDEGILHPVPKEHLDIARRGIEAYNRGDLDAIFELVTDDVEFVVPDTMANSGRYVGREGLRAMRGQWEEAWEEFRIEIGELTEEGDDVVVSVVQHGRGRGSGIETTMAAAHLMRFRDGQLCGWRLCETRAEALRHARI
jgi:ketosteroid isomerase-like protein